ncbi:MAG TPA: hypothetical protein VFN26_02540 [Candidatus Acidoferrum sp.]|nr:hypothetical protein [Candidatus Acidoferrum sp.]
MATYFGVDDGVTEYGVRGDSAASDGLLGNSTGGTGVEGRSRDGYGVAGFSNGSAAVYGEALARGNGLEGRSPSGDGVHGESFNFGVVGKGANAGVAAFNLNNDHAAYLASDCCAAWFTGGVVVTGPLTKDGGGFKIDHPLEPSEKYLSHSFVESSEMKNLYDGVAVTDANGEALVELPTWFSALNMDFRYQLTPIGAAAPNLHVAEQVSNNRFKIAGSKPGM